VEEWKDQAMTNEQQKAIQYACADLLGALEGRNNGRTDEHDWVGHVKTINRLINAYPFLSNFSMRVNALNAKTEFKNYL
jgi:hypothetical protein